MKMTYIMSCVWLDYMVKYFQCKNCVGSSLKTKKCVASFLVPGDISSVHKGLHFMNTRFFFVSIGFLTMYGAGFMPPILKVNYKL